MQARLQAGWLMLRCIINGGHTDAVAKTRICATLRPADVMTALSSLCNTIRADTTLDMSFTATRSSSLHSGTLVADPDLSATRSVPGDVAASDAILIHRPARRTPHSLRAARSAPWRP